MTASPDAAPPPPFDLLLVGQHGRVGYEAVLLLASLREADPGFSGVVHVAEPQPGPLWPEDPRMRPPVRAALQDLGARILPLHSRHFGASYPQGNKIEALDLLPADRPFLFLDSDILVIGALSGAPVNPARPTASRRVRDTWPKPALYGPSRHEIWASLYARFGLDIGAAADPRFAPEHPRHLPYFNAGWFNGACGPTMAAHFVRIATAIRDDPPPELAAQALTPWLDQIALPLVLQTLGGDGRSGPTLDGDVLWHYRTLPLFFATAPDPVVAQLRRLVQRPRLKRVLKRHPPFHKALYRGEDVAARNLFDRTCLPASEMVIRKRLRRAGLWRR